MSNPNDAPPPEDIAGLFRRFDGDAHAYKEFAPPEPVKAAPPKAWALLSGSKIDRTAAPAPVMAPPTAPVAAPAPLLVPAAPISVFAPVAVAPTPAAPLAPPVFAPAPAPMAATATVPPTTELQALFARLAEPQPRTVASASPMSRWRRPT